MRAERAGVILVVFLLASSDARAEPTAHERAAQSFQQARAAFARREYTAAAAAFEQAADYEPHPIAWLDAAEAWEKAGEPLRAAVDCDRVVQDPGATSAQRKEAETRLEVLSRRIATLRINGTDKSRASIDSGVPFVLPAQRRVSPGRHVVTFEEPTRRVEVRAVLGAIVTIEAPAPSVAPEARATTDPPTTAPPPIPPTRSGLPVDAGIAFGIAGVGAVTSAVFGVRTAQARDDFDATPSFATRDAFYRERAATDIALAVTVIAAATGVLFWTLSSPRKTAASDARPTQRIVFR